MHKAPLALLALLLLVAAPVMAQMDFNQTQQVRIALGDIPTTDVGERPGAWNVEDRRLVAMEDGSLTLQVPTGAVFDAIRCDCNHTVQADGDRHTVVFDDGATGPATVQFAYWYGGNDGRLAAHLALTSDALVILYVPAGTPVAASHPVPPALPSTPANPGLDIYMFQDITPTSFFVTAGLAVAPEPAATGFDFLALALGLLAGAALWALLVQRGVVQKRSRKQMAGTSAHKEIAARESRPILEARKRALMAALKELEMAKMNKDIPSEVYDVVKADLKKQTVTVMRAIEETPAAK